MKDLSQKQLLFVSAYCGNATQAAADAGYAGNRKTLEAVGRQNLANPRIAAAIQERQEKRTKRTIATREERQEFWTAVMRGEHKEGGADWKDRLKAAEMLGKSEGDFIDRHDLTSSDGSMSPNAETPAQAAIARFLKAAREAE